MTEVLHTRDHRRHGDRAFLRVELTDDAVVVVVHDVGPEHVREDTDESRQRWHDWADQLEPPSLTDDRGTAYRLSPTRLARGPGGNPNTAPIPLKATVAWHFLPPASDDVRRWTIDGVWTVERRG